ncbi:prolyl endopeptidase-like [Planococcus citri]|uniref:prolyl endopeptidase-like n=1 Tax=Planococcus citri TaxID=170843 RepID=UPI0031F74267
MVGKDSCYCDRKSSHLVFLFKSPLTPAINYHCDLSKASFDLEILNEAKDLKKDGNNFTYMFGVGDLDLSMFPYFVTSSTAIISNFDGIHVIASIRGGGEYGNKWHEGGMMEKKQNSFDDFIAAAEYLIAEKYTNSKLLAIEGGGANGGLLAGACLTQRPDLFGAVYVDEGTLDMLRFDKFTQQKVLVSEYGSPTDPKFFPLLHKYSPLHNIKIPEGCDKQYPAVMLYAEGLCDPDAPLHSLKFIATLQYEAKKHSNQKNPFILSMKTDTDDTSKSDKPDDHMYDDIIDMMSFFIINLGIKFHPIFK